MKAIMIMYDSLNRRLLETYGCEWTKTPNFKRLAERATTFDTFYVGSLPCMPARRDLQTGRYNFMHRSWGPVEPFDNSMPKILRENGVFTRLVSDHYHYWEDGGCTYHTMYSTYENIRGQEADQWTKDSAPTPVPDHLPTMREYTHPRWWNNSWANKHIIREQNNWPQTACFDNGLEFLELNRNKDNWFLQIETFDPHEPFDVPEEFLQLYQDTYDGKYFDWPSYAPVSETDAEVDHIKKRYAALLSMCDYNLGRILDFMDEHNMWEDTMLIVNTDHGFMLGEKDWWAKSVMPCYNEIAHTPFFLYDPRHPYSGERRQGLAQTIDIPATLLEFFGVDRPKEMFGVPLTATLVEDKPTREWGLFGFHGSFINITNGRYLYMRASSSVSNKPLFEYTLMPTHQDKMFDPEELTDLSLTTLPFSKGAMVMKIPNMSRLANATFCNSFQYGNLLFDLKEDPEQLNPIDNPSLEAHIINELIGAMKRYDAPEEQFVRLGLDPDHIYDATRVLEDRSGQLSFDSFEITKRYSWTDDAKNIFIGMLSLLAENQIEEYFSMLDQLMVEQKKSEVTREEFVVLAKHFYSENDGKVFYFLNKLSRIR